MEEPVERSAELRQLLLSDVKYQRGRRRGSVIARVQQVFEPFQANSDELIALSSQQRDLLRRAAFLRLIAFSMVLAIAFLITPVVLISGGFFNPTLEPFRNAAYAELAFCLIALVLQRLIGTTIASAIFALGGIVVVSIYVATAQNLSSTQTQQHLDQLGLLVYACLVILIFAAGFTLPSRMFWCVTFLLIGATIVSVWLFLPIEDVLRPDAVALLTTLQAVIAIISWVAARSAAVGVETALQAAVREREVAALKDQFIIVANHELRTPIMALYGNIELMQMMGPRLDEEQRQMLLERALSAGDDVMTLLSSVLDTSAISSQVPQLEITPISLAALVRRVIDSYDPRQLGEPGLENATVESRQITVDIPHDVQVLADESRLRQVLLNLLSNGLKYSAPMSPIAIFSLPASSVKLPRHLPHGGRVVRSNDMVVVSIRDFGLGIPPHDADKLFNRFVRLERDIAGSVRGTGVGLYLCRTLVEAMGGAIWVESSGVPGEGSTFSFTLPLLSSRILVAK